MLTNPLPSFTPTSKNLSFNPQLILEKLPELIKSIEQGLETVENDAAENGKDNSLLSSDPHSYYGVSKKSFY